MALKKDPTVDPPEDDSTDVSQSLPALRYITEDDSTSADSLLSDFKESSMAEGIEAENDSVFARKAQERALDAISEKVDTDLPALRVAGRVGEDVPDDDVWNMFQQSSLYDKVPHDNKESVESFLRDNIIGKVGDLGPEEEEEDDLQETPPEETNLKYTRALVDDSTSTDEEIVSDFIESEKYDPDSPLDPVTQAEIFSEKALFEKVNREVQKEEKRVFEQQGVSLGKDPGEKEKGWIEYFTDLASPQYEEEERPEEEPPMESDIPTPVGRALHQLTGESGTPGEQIQKLLGNRDVETSLEVEDILTRVADLPFSLGRFGQEVGTRSAGLLLETAENAGDLIRESEGLEAVGRPLGEGLGALGVIDDEDILPPEEPFTDTDLADVPGVSAGDLPETAFKDEGGSLKSSRELVLEAEKASDLNQKKSLLRVASMKKRKENFDNLSWGEATGRWASQLGRSFYSGIAGGARQIGAALHKARQDVLPDPQAELEDNVINQIADVGEHVVRNHLTHVSSEVDGGFWGDTSASALGSMLAFVGASHAAARAARWSTSPLRTEVGLSAGVNTARFSPTTRSAGRMTGLGADEIESMLGSEPLRPLVTNMSRVADDVSQGVTRSYIASNADDISQALKVGGASKFRTVDELTRADQNMIGATKIAPGIQGGGMVGWDAYERAKRIPDPSIYPKRIQRLIEKDRAGISLSVDEKKKLDNAVEQRAIDALWTAAPAGWSEAISGRVIDRWVKNLAGETSGVLASSFEGGAIEFTQESLASAFSESANKAVHNPDLQPLDRMLEEGFAGALAGAVTHGGATAAGKWMSQGRNLELLGMEDGRVPDSNLGKKRGAEYQKQRAQEESEEGEALLPPSTFARTLTDLENDGRASVVYRLGTTEADQVADLVDVDRIEAGDLSVYAEEEALKDQERVGEAVGAVIDAQDSLTDEQKETLKSRIYFHDVNSRPLNKNEQREQGFSDADETPHFTGGTTYQNMFDSRHFQESHIFADASRVDAFEELYHAIYDSADEATKQRALEAYNDTEGTDLESYEDNREEIARRFAEEIDSQIDIDPTGPVDTVRQWISSAADKITTDNAIQREVKSFLSGKADINWNEPITREGRAFVVVQPNTVHIETEEGMQVDEPVGIFQPEAEEVINRALDDLDQDKDPVFLIRPDPASAAVTGVGREGLMDHLRTMREEYGTTLEEIAAEVQAEIDPEAAGAQKASDAAQESNTSEGLPNTEMARNKLKSLGFRHENHAVNAVNKDRRDKGMEPYDPDETVPNKEIVEAAKQPDRIKRRIAEEGQAPPAIRSEESTESAGSLDFEQLRKEERRVRAWIRDVEVLDGGEQTLIQRARQKIKSHRAKASRLQEEGEHIRAEKHRRFADAIERGLNDRVQKKQRGPTDEEFDVERTGRPQLLPSTARVPTWAETLWIPQMQSVAIWDPAQPDPTGIRERLKSQFGDSGRQETNESQLPDIPDGEAHVIGTNALQDIGLERGTVLRIMDTQTLEINGEEVQFSQINQEDVDRTGVTSGDPLADQLDGTWVRSSDLMPAERFINQLEEQREAASEGQQETRVNQINDTLNRVRSQLQSLAQTPTREEVEDQIDLSEIDRVDPEAVPQRDFMDQLVFDLARARDLFIAGEFGEASRMLLSAKRRARESDEDVNLVDPNSHENKSIKAVRAAEIAQTIEDLRDEGVPSIEEEYIPVSSQEEMQSALEELGVSEEEAEASAAMFDARAEAFASQTGLSKSTWYKSRIGGLTSRNLGPDALNQIRAYHGTPYALTTDSQLSTEFIGDGEGNQAFGWGLYFTTEEVARNHYADQLAKRKGNAEWSVLGGSYQIVREAGDPTLRIIGPEGNLIDEVEPASTLGSRLRVAQSLEKARSLIAEHAALTQRIEGESLAVMRDAQARASESRTARRQLDETLLNNNDVLQAASRIRNLVLKYSEPGTDIAGVQAFAIEMLTDVRRELRSEGFSFEDYLSEGMSLRVWNALGVGADSDIILTASTEYGLEGTQLENFREELAGLTSEVIGSLEGSGYGQLVLREADAQSQYEQARESFVNEVDMTLENLDRTVVEALIHGDRPPGEYQYARWRDQVTDEDLDVFESVIDNLEEQGVTAQRGIKLDDLRDALQSLRDWDGEGRIPARASLISPLSNRPPDFGKLYKQIVERTSATPKDVSLALLDNGIDGIVYRGLNGQGNYDNYVVFDDSEITIESTEMFQQRDGNVLGSTDFMDDGRAIISLLEDADIDTVVEEFGHLLLEDMPFADKQIVAARLRGELGDDSITAHNLREHREAHEQFADWFRRYVREGEAPDTTLERIMAQLQDLMRRVWNSIAPTNWARDRVPADVRAAMDRLFRPDDPRAQLVEDADEVGPTTVMPGLQIQEDGTRVFYPQAYKNWVLSEQGNEMHAQLTPEEFAAYEEIANPNTRHQAATKQALQEGRDVPTASLIEYIENAPMDNETAAEIMNAEGIDVAEFPEAPESQIRRDELPGDVESDTDVESETEVGEDGDLTREVTDEQLDLAGVRTDQYQNERNVTRVQKGMAFYGGDIQYVTAERVEEFADIVFGQSERLQRVDRLESALQSDEYMTAEEIRDYREREEAFGQEITQDEQDRFNNTFDLLNEVMGADHPFSSLEGAINALRSDENRTLRKAKFYLEQFEVARSQSDYEGGETVSDEVREALNQIDPDDPLGSLERTRRTERARNDDLSWQEQGEGFTNIVEWFEEFWLGQSNRSTDARPGVVGLAEEFAGYWIEGDTKGREYIDYENGTLTVTFDQRGEETDLPNTISRASAAWRSFSRKTRAGDLNGGVMQVERDLHQEGIQDRGTLVTPNFAIEMRRMADGTYRLVFRDPTAQELEINRSERDRLRWQYYSDSRRQSLSEGPSDSYNDTFGADEGEYSMEEKLDVFTYKRATWEINDNLVLTERTALEGRSNAESMKFSVIVPEAQGPVSVVYDQESGQLGYVTDEDVAVEIDEQHGDQIADAIERIREEEQEGPDLFDEGEQVTSTESVSTNTQSYIEGLLEMLNLDQRVAVIDPSDVDPDNPGEFSGEHRAGRLTPHDADNEMEGDPTWIGEFGNGDYYIVVREDIGSDAYKSEAIAHEIGHLAQKEILNDPNHREARRKLQEEHDQLLDEAADMTVGAFVEEYMSYHRLKASDYLDSVADLTMSELAERNPEMFAYLTSFDEWFAEQMSRYVTTEDAVGAGDSVVRRLYNEIASYLRDIYMFLMENGFGPNVKFADWIDRHIGRKEYEGRIAQVELIINSDPYHQEVIARRAIENSRDTVPLDIRSEIREAVRGDGNIEDAIEPLPFEMQDPATRYARGFQNVIRAQNREFPSQGSGYVGVSYATSAPTPRTRENRFQRVWNSWFEDEGAPGYLNSGRRKYYTTIHRQVRLLQDHYPVLQRVTDYVFASADQKVDVETMEEGQRKARNRFGPRLADILRRVKGLSAFRPSVTGENWTAGADRIQEVVEILQRKDVDATSETSIRQVTNNDRVVRGALELREFFDDFYDYLVEREALPQDAKLDNYFPQTLDTDEVNRNPEAFKDMLVRQMEKSAAEKAGEDPETFELQGDDLVKAESTAQKITDIITGVETGFTVEELLRGEDMKAFAQRLDLKPSAMHHRHLLFLDHGDAEVQRFYQQDPVNALWEYVNGGIKFAEYATRFGPNNEKIQGVFEVLDENNATYAKDRLRGLLLSMKGQWVGTSGQNYYQYLRDSDMSNWFGRVAQGYRNAVSVLMLQWTGLTSTLPEALAIPARFGFTRTTKALPEAVMRWMGDGFNELHARSKQRLGGDGERQRSQMRRMMHESAVLADRSVDALMRSRMMTGSNVESEIMRWFFNANLLRPVQRFLRTLSAVAGKRHIRDALQNADRDSRMMREIERLGLPTNREARREVIRTIDEMEQGKEPAWESDEADTFLTALQRLGQQTVVESNPASRPLWMNDKNPAMRFMGQFKGFTAAFREGPLAYMSDETIQQFGEGNVMDGIRQSARLSWVLLTMGMGAALGDWLRWSIYYDQSDPKQREAYRNQRNKLNFGESLEALQRGHWGRAVEQVEGVPRIVERMGVAGTATNGVYFPITATRNYGSTFLIELMGPGVSIGSQFIQNGLKGNPGAIYDQTISIVPGGQAMRFREQYKDWANEILFKPIGQALDSPPEPEFPRPERNEDGTRGQ